MLKLQHLTKQFGAAPLFTDLCMDVDAPLVLWAPSGWGKTTLLRILMGLERQQLYQGAQRLHRRYQKHLLPDGHSCGLPDRQPERHRQQTAEKLLVLLHKLPSSPAYYKV